MLQIGIIRLEGNKQLARKEVRATEKLVSNSFNRGQFRKNEEEMALNLIVRHIKHQFHYLENLASY